MIIEIPNMTSADLQPYLITAIVCLGGAVGWLHRDTIKRMDKNASDLKTDFSTHKADTATTIQSLEAKWVGEIQKKQEAELRALKFEFLAKSPCNLAECPRRSSFSVGEAPIHGG